MGGAIKTWGEGKGVMEDTIRGHGAGTHRVGKGVHYKATNDCMERAVAQLAHHGGGKSNWGPKPRGALDEILKSPHDKEDFGNGVALRQAFEAHHDPGHALRRLHCREEQYGTTADRHRCNRVK